MIDRRARPPVRLLALSLPTLLFAGYDLARRSFLAPYLSGDLGLPIGTVGWLVMLANFASIPAEVLAGALGDRGSARIGRRAPWMLGGTVLIILAGGALLLSNGAAGVPFLALALVGLVVGWAICNVTHGAWALEATAGAARVQIFGLRTLFGLAGGVAFSLLAMLQAGRAPSSFVAMLLAILVGAPLAHALLIARAPDRPAMPHRWHRAALIEPVRLLFANRPNRLLAALFALNGAHTAITGTGYLYVVGFALALPGWGATGIFVQTLCAAIGVVATLRLGTRIPPARLLRIILWANLLLGAALIAVPPERPAILMLWSALFGLVSAIDFMALRVLLGARLDADTGANADTTRAAAYYAGFHVPFNLCGALGAGLLFAGYHAAGFDPRAPRGAEHAFLAVQLLPALAAILLMAISLWILRISAATRARPALERPPKCLAGLSEKN